MKQFIIKVGLSSLVFFLASCSGRTLKSLFDEELSVPAQAKLSASQDTGTSNTDGITSVNTNLALTGEGLPANALVHIFDNDSEVNGSPIYASASGAWSFTLAGPLSEGNHPITIRYVAPDGQLSGTSAVFNLVIDTIQPQINSVSAAETDGTYTIGDHINIQLNANERIHVSGTPFIRLVPQIGPNVTKDANYFSGSASNQLLFRYTVVINDNAIDLEYESANSLSLAGGMLQDTAGNNLVLTLPIPGNTGSLGVNKNIVFDTNVPYVTQVTSAKANGSYTIGEVVTIDVTFSAAVDVTGVPQLVLATGTPVTSNINCNNGTGILSLQCSYTVAAGNSSNDLTYNDNSSLVLNGGTIKKAGQTANASLALPTPGSAGSLSFNKALVIDTSVPTVVNVSSSNANGNYGIGADLDLTVTFSEPVIVAAGTPTLTISTGSPATTAVNYFSGSGSATLTFRYTVASGNNSADLDYASTTALVLAGATIRDSAGNNGALTLPSPGITGSLGNNKNIMIDGAAPVVTSVTSSKTNGSYGTNEVINVQVIFSEMVDVTGVPQLGLATTSPANTAINYVSGSGSNTLVFQYTVNSGNSSADLDYVASNSLTLNGGSILDIAANSANLALPAPGAAGSLGANKAIVIDAVAPTVTNVSATSANGTYGIGQNIDITVTFSEAVTVSGTPTLSLSTGTPAITAVNYFSGSGTNTLTFRYTVTVGNVTGDLDYNSTAALGASGTIADSLGNPANRNIATPGAANSLGANKAIVIDGIAPIVTNVSSTTAAGQYGNGAVISIQVVFDQNVNVTGTPTLALSTSSPATTNAIYVSGTGTNTLNFSYTVAAGNVSADLDYNAATSLSAGSSISDTSGNNANLTLPTPGSAGSLAANEAIIINGVSPTVQNVTASNSNGSYDAGEIINIEVVFSEAVTVAGGTPQLTLSTGNPSTTTVNYSSGSGTNTLVFSYTVAAGNSSADLDYSSTLSLSLNGASIVDADNLSGFNNANLILTSPGLPGSLGANKALIIDTAAPVVTNVTSSSANGSYGIGSNILIQVVFSEIVNVSGTPTLTLATGNPVTTAINYTSGSGTNTLTFTYTVVANNSSSDLEYSATNALSLGTSIQDIAGNNASLTLPNLGATGSLAFNKAIVINTNVPSVTDVTSSSSDGSYKTGSISIQVVFSANVNVTGTPTLALNSGGNATYSSGSGSTTLTFTYTIAGGHNSSDLDYTATNSLALAGGSINATVGGTPGNLTLAVPGAANSLASNKAIVIDTTAPLISNVTSSAADGSYDAGSVITIQVVFSEIVFVAGTPTLTLATGSPSTTAINYVSGSGSNTLNFNYTVIAGNSSLDLNYAATTALTAGSSIQDLATNDATLTLPGLALSGSLAFNKAIVIDTTAPTVISVAASNSNGTYGTGAVISVQVVFSEAVTVSGTPTLTLATGSPATTALSYTSGSGSNTLVFDYLVASGNINTDLDYNNTTALSAGIFIRDQASNNAVLTLPVPGSINSLAGTKNIAIDAVGPAVTNVTSSNSNGYYKAGQAIIVQVTFNKSVNVTGSPLLSLATGSPASTAISYTSGNGTNILSFTYNVVSGNAAADLDYSSNLALSLNGGTIIDDFGNNAALGLPNPGAAGSLAFNKGLIIDTAVPVVTNLNSATANGTYGVNSIISIIVNFSEVVTVTGTPTLTLATAGSQNGTASYVGGSGTTALEFEYHVGNGEVSPDLDYIGTGALMGTIRDVATNGADLTLPAPGAANSLAANKALVIDGVVPTVLGVSRSLFVYDFPRFNECCIYIRRRYDGFEL